MMSDFLIQTLIGISIATVIGMIGWFLIRLVSGIEDSVKNLRDEVYNDRTILTKHSERMQTEVHALGTKTEILVTKVDYLTKTSDDVKKGQATLAEQVAAMSNKLVATDTKVENLGKIIPVGIKKN